MRFLLVLLLVTTTFSARVRCDNFATQAEAQAFMKRNNAYYLDRDRDGQACECLPGGSKYGSSKCRKR